MGHETRFEQNCEISYEHMDGNAQILCGYYMLKYEVEITGPRRTSQNSTLPRAQPTAPMPNIGLVLKMTYESKTKTTTSTRGEARVVPILFGHV